VQLSSCLLDPSDFEFFNHLLHLGSQIIVESLLRANAFRGIACPTERTYFMKSDLELRDVVVFGTSSRIALTRRPQNHNLLFYGPRRILSLLQNFRELCSTRVNCALRRFVQVRRELRKGRKSAILSKIESQSCLPPGALP
jgi:hypothetical protein